MLQVVIPAKAGIQRLWLFREAPIFVRCRGRVTFSLLPKEVTKTNAGSRAQRNRLRVGTGDINQCVWIG
jgi:hypothetical protein